MLYYIYLNNSMMLFFKVTTKLLINSRYMIYIFITKNMFTLVYRKKTSSKAINIDFCLSSIMHYFYSKKLKNILF